MRKAAAVCLLAILIPYITTLAWTGRVEGNTDRGAVSGRTILLDREGSPAPVDMEEYLIGITALQIPAEYDMEAIKAQAIIARTYLCKQMQGKDRIEESALDLDYLEQSHGGNVGESRLSGKLQKNKGCGPGDGRTGDTI